ncbi:MAG: glycosyltransferase family 4 protein [Polyangiaceae bacterium]
MRIGILIPEFPTQTHIFFWREVVALRKLGHSVSLLSTRRPKDACPHEFAQEAAAETHYVYPPEVGASARSLSSGRGLARTAAYVASLSGSGKERARALGFAVCGAALAEFARRRGLEHVHVHSCADAAHVAAVAHLLRDDLSYSVHVHGDLAVYGGDHAQKMGRAAFVAVAANPHAEQVVEQAGIPRSRVVRMPMGVDITKFEPRRFQTDSRAPLHLVSVGRMNRCKGHVYAFEAIRRLLDSGVDLRYTVAGSGPDADAIRGDVARLKLESKVDFVGSKSESQVRELLGSADAFLLTSVGLGEASPVAVMEAMAAGIPVICSRIGGTADMIDSGVDSLLVHQEDVAGITDAIRLLHDDRMMLSRLGAGARERAAREFDSVVLARKFVAAIEAHAPKKSHTASAAHA